MQTPRSPGVLHHLEGAFDMLPQTVVAAPPAGPALALALIPRPAPEGQIRGHAQTPGTDVPLEKLDTPSAAGA